MKLILIKDQSHQLEGFESPVGLFDIKKLGQGELMVAQPAAFLESAVQTELGLGNRFGLGLSVFLQNLNDIREKNMFAPMSEAGVQGFRMNFPVNLHFIEYNPDTGFSKVADGKLSVHETKNMLDFMKLWNSMVNKVRCGQANLRTLGGFWG